MRRWVVPCAAVLLLASGWLVPRWTLSDGVDRYSDPVARGAAIDALDLASTTCLATPGSGLIATAVRVSEVRSVPGSCTIGPDPGGAAGDYVVKIRVHGPFAVPVRTFTATCGGAHLTC
ncbi:MAG TPA: hypothetical protein VF613_14110 [Longimicrobium sp.]|jgi:hypothetical protein